MGKRELKKYLKKIYLPKCPITEMWDTDVILHIQFANVVDGQLMQKTLE